MSDRHPFAPNRRNLLGLTGTGLAAALLPHAAVAAQRLVTPGLQSITVMTLLGDDLPGTLRAVRRIGYRDIETIGTLGTSAAALNPMLRDAGLRSTAQHLCPAAFYPQMLAWARGQASLSDTLAKLDAVYAFDHIDAVLDEGIAAAHRLGQRTLIWSYLPKSLRTTRDGMSRIAETMNRAGHRCRREGLVFGFHNGSTGFAPIEGERPYDLLLRETDPDLFKMELDVYWMSKVGGDPIAYLKANPGRYPLMHLKDMDAAGHIVGIGQGVLDFPAIIAAARASGVTGAFVEYDEAPHPLDNARDAFGKISRLLA